MPYPSSTILPLPRLASLLSTRDAAALEKLSDVPIDKLPTEILQKIFADIPSEYRGSLHAVSLMLSLQSVCRRWRSVLLATPEYWVQGIQDVTDLYVARVFLNADEEDGVVGKRANPRLLDLFLTRSAPCPFQLEDYMSIPRCPGWKAFVSHFDRVNVFKVSAVDAVDLRNNILPAVATKMRRLERFELSLPRFEVSTEGIDQWEAHNLPHLQIVNIPSTLFCRAMAVPSLHTVTLSGERDIESLPDLLAALERCPALSTLSLHLSSNRHSVTTRPTPERTVELLNLRKLVVAGSTSGIYALLSSLSFPSATHLELFVTDAERSQSVLPSVLPRHHSGLYTSPTLDRVGLHTHFQHYDDTEPEWVSMRGFVQDEERLRVSPVLRLDSGADGFLQVAGALRACTLTALALNLFRVTDDMDRAFWARFFAALPGLRRLELLSAQHRDSCRAMKRDAAEQFLAASRANLKPVRERARRGVSLAWRLCPDKDDASQLEREIGDVEEVVSGHAHHGVRLERLELYACAFGIHDLCSNVVDVMQIQTDAAASQLVARDCVSRLESVVEVVVVAGPWTVIRGRLGRRARYASGW
ncbi:hypothetical protein GSI_04574 [Ganoderma sinense ZZ0214-1]|uniref:F-box domain-containing protein n=1 Tax=Ganoderma sinense ZZ0214-1 TaxID=1077348 RepID=A0A2G8SH67_9APHY|nr:hypothetical protein GSI_04574 [Ganoderma sinense ZZ0214-1]